MEDEDVTINFKFTRKPPLHLLARIRQVEPSDVSLYIAEPGHAPGSTERLDGSRGGPQRVPLCAHRKGEGRDHELFSSAGVPVWDPLARRSAVRGVAILARVTPPRLAIPRCCMPLNRFPRRGIGRPEPTFLRAALRRGIESNRRSLQGIAAPEEIITIPVREGLPCRSEKSEWEVHRTRGRLGAYRSKAIEEVHDPALEHGVARGGDPLGHTAPWFFYVLV